MSILDSIARGCSFDEFEYQILYMRPSQQLDERIAVGVIAETAGSLEVRLTSSVDSIQSMGHLIGEEGVEQFQFAAGELRRAVSRTSKLDLLCLPTDLFVTGDRLVAFTSDRAGLLKSILSSSCLARGLPERRIQESVGRGTDFSRTILEQVSRLSPIVADRIFNRKVTVENDELKLPIFGDRIFGAPVSFATKDHTMQTEAYIAKFRWLRHCLLREPRIYVLRPQQDSRGHENESRLKNLGAIADASDVRLRIADTTEEIAAQILRDEAA